MPAKVGNLQVEMSANVARLQRDFQKATTQAQAVGRRFTSIFKNVGLSVAAGLSVRAMTNFVKNAIDAADALAKQAAKANVATGTFQELTFALDKFDVSQEMAASGLAAFTKRLGELRAGTGALTTFLKKYDTALLASLASAESNEEALNLFIDALSKVKNDADRAALSAAAFSRSAGIGMASAFKDGGVALNEWRRKIRELGIVIDDKLLKQAEEAKDQLSALSQVIKTRGVVAVAELTPQISKLAESLAEIIPNIQGLAQGLSEIIDYAVKAADTLDKLNKSTRGWLKTIAGKLMPGHELLDALKLIRQINKESEHGASRSWGEPETKQETNITPVIDQEAIDKIQKVIDQLRFEKEQLGRNATQQEIYNKLKAAGVSINSEAGQSIARLVTENAALEKSQEALKISQDNFAEATRVAVEKTKEYWRSFGDEAAAITASIRTPFEQAREQIIRLQFLQEKGLINKETYGRAYKQIVQGYIDTQEQAKETTEQMSEFTKQAFSNMTDYAQQFFFDAMKGEFDNLGLAFLDMINGMIANWTASELMKGLFGESFGSGGELGGILGSVAGAIGGAIFTGTGSTTASTTVGNTFALNPRASGGPVFPGKGYLVGEEGPELLLPNTPGTIIPNDQLTGGSKAQAQSPTTIIISAVDAKSFEDLCRRNPQAIVGRIEESLSLGNRSLKRSLRSGG